jgi:glycosyltransferase involved in cell wall biosynthesis
MVSIITPLHKPGNQYVKETYASLVAQTDPDFEWIVVLNNGGILPASIREDKRVKVYHSTAKSIGALKHYACSKAISSIIIELDADDMLVEEAVAKIKLALEPEGVVFCFSDTIEFNSDWSSRTYGAYWGWTEAKFSWHGKEFTYNKSFDVNPASLRQIFWTPNHVRAWKTEAYNAIHGHDDALPVGDDHDLIMRFYIEYGAKSFVYISDPLYIYRVHDENTCTVRVEEIAQQSWRNYEKYHEVMALRWATDNDLLKLDLGGRLASPDAYQNVDLFDAKYNCDLNKDWPFKDNSVGVLRATDFIEHLKDPVHMMNEAYRVLAPGGWLLISVPSTDGRGAFQDPTHVSFWNENSFWYYTDQNYAKYIPKFTGKFQLSRCITYFPSDWHKQHNIPYTDVELIAYKNHSRQPGELLWQS